ncbi:hypothetical protein GGR55DRAFT_686048 [Xylaria sp. FL0064]|nr:hypothetical protein GGR55DRAFT_686048 [Xylaria sp. FL0064]
MAPVEAPSDSGGDATLGVSGLVIVLAVISVILRFYTRIFTRQGLKLDNWLILAAVIATLATTALLLWGNAVDPEGLWVSENTDPNYVYTDQDVFYLKLAFATSVLYFTIAGATKLGILCMYYRIFHWSWLNGLADPRYCFNYNIFWMASGACEIFLDVLILTLPISVLARLQLSRKRKLAISGVFLLGGFVVVTGIVKVILGYPPGSRVPSYSNTEVWTTVHTGIAIVCSSLPILNPLLNRIARSRTMTKISTLLSNTRDTRRRRPYSTIDQGEGGSGNPLSQNDRAETEIT